MNWQFETLPERGAVRSLFSGRDTQYQVFAMRLESEGLYRIAILCPIAADAAVFASLGEFLHRINATLPLGAFELDYDLGSVRFVHSFDPAEEAVSPPCIVAAVQRGLTSFETVWPELLAVAEGAVAAKPAFLRCQIALELPALNARLQGEGAALRLPALHADPCAAVIASGGAMAITSAREALEQLFGEPLPFALIASRTTEMESAP
jgi:hypothetical protein